MRQEFRTIRLGVVLGHELVIRHPVRQSVEQPETGDDILVYDGKQLAIDIQNMRPQLVRLLPSGYLTPQVKPQQWERFILLARGMGYL